MDAGVGIVIAFPDVPDTIDTYTASAANAIYDREENDNAPTGRIFVMTGRAAGNPLEVLGELY